MLLLNNDSIVVKMAGWKWCHHIADFFQYMHTWNQGCSKIIMICPCYNSCFANVHEIWKNEWLQLLFHNKTFWSPYGWLQWNWELALKKGMAASACFIETQHPRSLQVTCPKKMTVPFKCMIASASLKSSAL